MHKHTGLYCKIIHINKGNYTQFSAKYRGMWCHCPTIHLCIISVDLVALSSLVEVFREQELQQGEHVMDVVEMIHGLTALYERLEEQRSILVNIPLCVDMCLNWLLNVYDRWVGWDVTFGPVFISEPISIKSCSK